MEPLAQPLLHLLIGLGTINSFVFGVYLLFTQIGKRRANHFLGIFLILLSIRFLRSIHFAIYGLDTVFYYIGHAAYFLSLPFLYFYYRASFTDSPAWKMRDMVHLAAISPLFINSFWYMNMAGLIVLLFYTVMSHRILANFSKSIRKASISERSYNIQWYKLLLFILYANIGVYLVNLIFRIIPFIAGALSYSLVFYLMLFYYNRHLQYARQRKIVRKYTNARLSEQESTSYKELLFEKITHERLYLDPDMTLKKLANLLSIPYYQLSQLINNKLGKNFSEFINAYRIEEAKRLLCDPEHQDEKIESIGYDAGFSNPSSFYAAFKKETQLTPSAFKKKHKKITPDL